MDIEVFHSQNQKMPPGWSRLNRRITNGHGLLGLRTLRPVTGTSLTTGRHTQCVEHTANDLVTHTWKVTHTTATDEHNAMLLKVVAFTGDVRRQFLAIRQANTSDLSKSRVRLLRSHGSHLQADATLLRAAFQQRCLGLLGLLGPRLADQLIDCRHDVRRSLSGTHSPSGPVFWEVEECTRALRDGQATGIPCFSGSNAAQPEILEFATSRLWLTKKPTESR